MACSAVCQILQSRSDAQSLRQRLPSEYDEVYRLGNRIEADVVISLVDQRCQGRADETHLGGRAAGEDYRGGGRALGGIAGGRLVPGGGESA